MDDPVFKGPWSGPRPSKPLKGKIIGTLFGYVIAVTWLLGAIATSILLIVAIVLGLFSFILDCIDNIGRFLA